MVCPTFLNHLSDSYLLVFDTSMKIGENIVLIDASSRYHKRSDTWHVVMEI